MQTMYEGSALGYYALAILSAVYIINSLVTSETYKLRNTPTVAGSSLPILSFWGVVRMFRNGPAIVGAGYEKYKGGAFKFAEMTGWRVLLTDPRSIDELLKAPADVFSLVEAMKRMIHIRYTLGDRTAEDDYHTNVLRFRFTRSIDEMYPSIHDEQLAAFSDNLVLKEDVEWTPVSIMDTALKIVSRMSNRSFVGLPACRNPKLCELSADFAVSMTKTSIIINMFPPFLHPFVGPLVSTLESDLTRYAGFVGDVIQHRLDMRAEYGDDWEKPCDLLQFIVDVAPEQDLTVRGMCMRLLVSSVGAIHTTSMNFTYALYRIASNPDEYLLPLQEEVDAVVAEHGWTRASLREMRKLDSFMKEILRTESLGLLISSRYAVKDYTFSNGTYIPKGTIVAVASYGLHKDDTIWSNAHEFDPWRFSKVREGASEDGERAGLRAQLITTSPEFLAFGHGRHACPGRFLAMTELKSMLAHIVQTYDVKMENEGVLPSAQSFGSFVLPDTSVRVMFRKRKT